mgnify:CR=1 FL=1
MVDKIKNLENDESENVINSEIAELEMIINPEVD